MRSAPALLAVLALASLAPLAACGDQFDPASRVDDLRVLGVRAEPPEIATPDIGAAFGVPDRTALSALVADPAQLADPGRAASVVYLACTDDPLDPEGGACTSFESFRDVPALARAARPPGEVFGRGEVGAVTFSGLEGCVHGEPCVPPTALAPPAYVLPPDLRLDFLPAGMPQRVVGIEVVVIAVAVAAAPEELLAAGPAGVPERLAELLPSREHVVAVKRLAVRGPDATDEPNLNPVVGGIAADGVELPAAVEEGPVFAPGAGLSLTAVLPAGAEALFQPFTDYDAFGRPIAPAVEEWVYSFFATAGDLDRVHTRSTGEKNRYTAPDAGEALLYLVVRDHRGGADWTVRRIRVGPADAR
jgi:hypothetical protein